MTTFYCIRHGKTVFNQQNVLQGGMSDSPLLEEGISYAKLAGNYLSDVKFDKVFASPQKRAQDTAQYILDNHPSDVEIQTENDLREIEFGEWDGKPAKDFEHFPEFEQLLNAPHLYDPSSFGGESFHKLLERTTNLFNDLTEKYPNDTILIVAHGLTLQTILKHFDGQDLETLRQGDFLDNTSISILETNPNSNELELISWNDTTHTKNM